MSVKLLGIVVAMCAAVATNPLAAQSASPAGVLTRTSAGAPRLSFRATDTAPERQRPSRAQYVILGFLAGATVGGVVAAHHLGSCDDWCLPGLSIAVGAVAGGAAGSTPRTTNS
jgi:uncharacterized protein YcfJ